MFDLNCAYKKSSVMDIPSWIVSGDPKREVINCQGACKCNCNVTNDELTRGFIENIEIRNSMKQLT